ncbi:hypothetical protein KUA23_05680 [Pseudomonas pergaminensis]|uniref:Uncharacterized protein n=1 Tax=Pseudomonas pergaminensis TaxID=2853159 RepID=A0ABD7TQR8_9PSED|nr:hypothetical protein [Pseudomonas pergaminensis]
MKVVPFLRVLYGPGLAAAVSMLLVLPAHGAVQDITASFRPDPSNPMVNEFVNTTPQSGICPGHIPAYCKANGLFTIRTSDLLATASRPILANHENPRDGAMWKVPSEWRDLEVTHSETGQTETVQMRIAGIGHRWDVRPNVTVWSRPDDPVWNWYRQWYYAPPPCQGVNWLANANSYLLFFWLVPENAGVCNRVPGQDITQFWFSTTEYAYSLRTPNPLAMASGEYTGSLTYSVGPGADFDFGDVIIPNDNALTFNFTLTVDHHLKVEVPPGGHRIQLEPQGGWQGWLQSGRKPTRLFHDQTVNLWASTAFKMSLECGDPLGNTCSVRNAAGHQVPLDIAVTLPAGLSDSAGRPVSRLPLRLDGSGTQLFRPSRYVDRKPSTLHFEIQADGVSQMLDQNSGNAYSGTATVVWDSEV